MYVRGGALRGGGARGKRRRKAKGEEHGTAPFREPEREQRPVRAGEGRGTRTASILAGDEDGGEQEAGGDWRADEPVGVPDGVLGERFARDAEEVEGAGDDE